VSVRPSGLVALAFLFACKTGAQDDTADTSDTATADVDADGLSGADEEANGCDPDDADSDDDGLLDGAEVAAGTDCANPDTDGDDLCDGTRVDDDADGILPASECNLSEALFGCDPVAADGDAGGTPDGTEVFRHGTDCASADDDLPICLPNFDFETWDGSPSGYAASSGLTVTESSSGHGGSSTAAAVSWAGATPLDLWFTEPIGAESPSGYCVFRAWVEEDDFNVQAYAVARTVIPDGSGGWTESTEYVGTFGSGDGGWQEVVVEFPCGGFFRPALRFYTFGSTGAARTDDWLVHAADQVPFTLWDSHTDPSAKQISGPDGPEDIYARLQSSSATDGLLYVSAPWAPANMDRAVLVWTGEPGGTADAPWDKAGTIPDSDGRLLALMQKGSDRTCEWLEWAPFGTQEWVSVSTTCSGEQTTSGGDRIEGTFQFTSSTTWPETFYTAAVAWQGATNGQFVPQQQIPSGDNDTTLEASETLGPTSREELFPGVEEPCAGLGDPEACPTAAPVASRCATGNLLEDGGFEGATYSLNVPDETGAWAGDSASIVGAVGCLSPVQGTEWLQFAGTDPFGASADDRADVIQLLDAGPLRGDTLTLSADVVRGLADVPTDAFFGVEARLYEGVPDDFPVAWARGEGTVLGVAGAYAAEVPDKPWGAARPSTTFTVPAGSGDAFIAVVVFAVEDLANEDEAPELGAHFVDDVCLVPQP